MAAAITVKIWRAPIAVYVLMGWSLTARTRSALEVSIQLSISRKLLNEDKVMICFRKFCQ